MPVPVPRAPIGVLLTAFIVTACQTPPPPAPPQDTSGLPSVPACADQATATLAEGVNVQYRGSDPADSDRCLVQWSGRAHPLYFGFWSHERPTALSAEARSALRAALTGPVGTEASFETERSEMWRRVTVSHVRNTTAVVAQTQRPALELRVVRHDAQGRPDVRDETHFLIDRATGVLLRRETVTPMQNGEVQVTVSWQIGELQRAG